MKFTGYTDGDDWNIRTLLWMMARRECWWVGWYWREWELKAGYTWYDGPIWHLCVGPLAIAISY